MLDSFAVLSFLEDEPGAAFVRELLEEAEAGRTRLAMCVVNLGEIWYAIARAVSPELADTLIAEIRSRSIEIVDADWPLTLQAAIYKSRGGISYADCFAAALAKIRQAELVTGDPEFRRLADEITVVWRTDLEI